jgi:hypothetical protein
MLDYNEILSMDPYILDREAKAAFLSGIIQRLTWHHYNECSAYHRILDALGKPPEKIKSLIDLPFLPVRLFKQYTLRSVEKNEIIRTMTSSGTSGAAVSKIFLDRKTSANQTKALARIVTSYIGKARLPLIILDTSAVLKDRKMFSARGAGILGFSIFGKDKIYAFDEDMNLDIKGIEKFLQTHANENVLLFGFTFMIWQHFYELLKKHKFYPDLSQGVMIHGGGWKKLADKAVSAEEFKQALNRVCGITRVYEYYGMVEQTGTIYMACDAGHLHASVYSDIIIRRHDDFYPAAYGEKGIIQTLSALPFSYPGHSLLTEDEGILLGEDDCPCGRKGKYFKVLGRIKKAEIRGCSDVYASECAAS